jgi:hypothetical protein
MRCCQTWLQLGSAQQQPPAQLVRLPLPLLLLLAV